ncbi:hypothetical protein [Nocardioides sp.]|uniref:hypothetical protein n=1 Tax=Nocardioides sp. TaxID=35761 RepID=UPI002CD6EDD0|nr:hypothetical protein [Nocardioides sp.]HXH78125.1 hypothetical protein [Nocardioides sp.]
MSSQVVGADFTDGALLPNYVNGRLLVAEDLATSQQSLRTRDTRIGEAAGAGTVRGLWVTGSQTTLTIQPGLALCRAGGPVVVPRAVTLKLTHAVAAQPVDDSDFSCCGGAPGGEEGSALTEGMLLLTARASCRLDGQAPLVPPPTTQVSSCCAAQWQVEGVEFRAIVLPVGSVVAGAAVTDTNRRNLVAHWCFGTEQLLRFGRDPFAFDPAYGGFDRLAAADLTPYDVPLAVLHWDGHAVIDLDNWSARRRVTQPDAVPSAWSATVSERRESDGIARFLQFQDQAEELVSRALAGSARADTFFGQLPPVGFLPVDNSGFRKLAEEGVRDLAKQPAHPTYEEAAEAAENAWTSRRYRMTDSVPGESAENELQQIEIVSGVKEAVKTLRKEHISAFKQLLAVADASVGHGYDPERFFGSLGRSGGFLDWELAEWALEQSWRAMPVATRTREDDDPDAIADAKSNRERRDHADMRRATPFTYYYVIQNLETAADNTALYRQMSSRKRRANGGFSASRLYVVFIANRRWATRSRPPWLSYHPTGMTGAR